MPEIPLLVRIKTALDKNDLRKNQSIIQQKLGTEVITRKGKAMNVMFERTGRILGTLTKTAIGFGAAMVGGLTAALATSPHFKAFMMSLKAPWMRLQQFMGGVFSPTLKKLSSKISEFVSIFIANKDVRDFFKRMSEGMVGFLDKISRADMQNFIKWTGEVGGKALTYTLNIGRILGEGVKAILDIWGAGTETIEKTLGIKVKGTPEMFAALAGASLVMGHPWIAGALASMAVGATLQQTLGDPEPFRPYASPPTGDFRGFSGHTVNAINLIVSVVDRTISGASVDVKSPNTGLEVTI